MVTRCRTRVTVIVLMMVNEDSLFENGTEISASQQYKLYHNIIIITVGRHLFGVAKVLARLMISRTPFLVGVLFLFLFSFFFFTFLSGTFRRNYTIYGSSRRATPRGGSTLLAAAAATGDGRRSRSRQVSHMYITCAPPPPSGGSALCFLYNFFFLF